MIDALVPCIPNGAWRWTEACHLFVHPTTDLDVLHRFARQIGLKRAWFQDRSAMPHYDLNPRRRLAAVAAGAHEVDMHTTGDCIKAWRGHWPVANLPPLELPL